MRSGRSCTVGRRSRSARDVHSDRVMLARPAAALRAPGSISGARLAARAQRRLAGSAHRQARQDHRSETGHGPRWTRLRAGGGAEGGGGVGFSAGAGADRARARATRRRTGGVRTRSRGQAWGEGGTCVCGCEREYGRPGERRRGSGRPWRGKWAAVPAPAVERDRRLRRRRGSGGAVPRLSADRQDLVGRPDAAPSPAGRAAALRWEHASLPLDLRDALRLWRADLEECAQTGSGCGRRRGGRSGRGGHPGRSAGRRPAPGAGDPERSGQPRRRCQGDRAGGCLRSARPPARCRHRRGTAGAIAFLAARISTARRATAAGDPIAARSLARMIGSWADRTSCGATT